MNVKAELLKIVRDNFYSDAHNSDERSVDRIASLVTTLLDSLRLEKKAYSHTPEMEVALPVTEYHFAVGYNAATAELNAKIEELKKGLE